MLNHLGAYLREISIACVVMFALSTLGAAEEQEDPSKDSSQIDTISKIGESHTARAKRSAVFTGSYGLFGLSASGGLLFRPGLVFKGRG